MGRCVTRKVDPSLPFCILRYFVENGVLQIVNVSHSDRGVYTCAARTPVDGDEASATLLVLGEPANHQTTTACAVIGGDLTEGAFLTFLILCQLRCFHEIFFLLVSFCCLVVFLSFHLMINVSVCAYLLSRFPDVPDAPEHLVLSEHKGKSVKLKWIPGDDHNSSTTGTEGELHSLSFNPPSYLWVLPPNTCTASTSSQYGHLQSLEKSHQLLATLIR